MWCAGLNLKAYWIFLVLAYLPTSTFTIASTKFGILGLQHRDFDRELASKLSMQERLESAVRRSHARRARIEGMLSKARQSENIDRTTKVNERDREATKLEASNATTKLEDSNGSKRFPQLGGLIKVENSSRGEGYAAEVEAEDGAFVTSIHIGTPPARVRAILDTGSDLVWQQCRPCISCFLQPDLPIFDPSLSSSFKRATCAHKLCQQLLQSSSSSPPSSPCSNASCPFTYMYGDNSFTSGELAFDTLSLLDPLGQRYIQVKEFAFGCGHEYHGASFSGADGILGMGQGPLSLASQLSSPSFSYCLASLKTSQSSHLLFGDHATDLLHGDKGSQVQVTSILSNKFLSTFYYLDLIAVSLDGVHLDIPARTFSLKANGSGGMIVDSGTTITYLQERGYRIVLQSIQSKLIEKSQVSRSMHGLDLCVLASNESMLPNLTFHFDGANMEVPSTSLFIQVSGTYCLALGSSHDFSILGNVQQQNYKMLFDRSRQKLSFVHMPCGQALT